MRSFAQSAAASLCVGGAATLLLALAGCGGAGTATGSARLTHSVSRVVAVSAAPTHTESPTTRTTAARTQRVVSTTPASRTASEARTVTESGQTSAAGAPHGTVVGNDDGSLHLVRASGSILFEEGRAQGTLPGSMRARLHVGATFSGIFVLSTPNGEVEGRGSATPQGGGRIESFAGTAHIVGGTGRYAHAHGTGGFFGTFNRSTYAVTIQTRGSFSY